MFMEHWKRRQMRLNYEWDLTGFEDEEVGARNTCSFCWVKMMKILTHSEESGWMTWQLKLVHFMY